MCTESRFSSERCVSVYRGLCACEGTDYVYIQDAVRPFVTAEILENYENKYNYWLVVIQPCAGLSTARVFSLWKETAPASRPDTDAALNALETGDFPKLCESIGNVLQPVACRLRPEIEKTCGALMREGAMTARMTGSGSAVFGVFRNAAASEKAWKTLAPLEKNIFLCHTQHDSLRILDE